MSQDNREESAIDAIYSMQNDIKEIRIGMRKLETILSLTLSRMEKQARSVPSALEASVKVDSSVNRVSQQKVEKLVLGATKVYGNIVNKSKEPISGVMVKVYNESSELIKDLETDVNGHWAVRLPAGRYGIEYLHKNFKPINKTIKFDKDNKSFEVT